MQCQIATGERAGQRVHRRLLDPEEGVRSGPCFASRGFSLHAAQIVLSPEELLEKLAALVPPPRLNLVRYSATWRRPGMWHPRRRTRRRGRTHGDAYAGQYTAGG